jgi:hypothetical protein
MLRNKNNLRVQYLCLKDIGEKVLGLDVKKVSLSLSLSLASHLTSKARTLK